MAYFNININPVEINFNLGKIIMNEQTFNN